MNAVPEHSVDEDEKQNKTENKNKQKSGAHRIDWTNAEK
jgi:hypothetical protein